ncbi:MAG: hypothetical protein O2955_02920 [Planctomycetota bacterium]|nr:hypothetical protein [Planctomycetota bacterium]MDA1211439.1 hypothetical protein [Planctomycetota bacterium]
MDLQAVNSQVKRAGTRKCGESYESRNEAGLSAYGTLRMALENSRPSSIEPIHPNVLRADVSLMVCEQGRKGGVAKGTILPE